MFFIMGNPGLWNVRDQIFGYLDYETREIEIVLEIPNPNESSKTLVIETAHLSPFRPRVALLLI